MHSIAMAACCALEPCFASDVCGALPFPRAAATAALADLLRERYIVTDRGLCAPNPWFTTPQ
jgi:hypothetical protein